MKRLTISFLTLFCAALLALTACGKIEEADNVITDPEGITVELTWTNSASDPLDGANLDLYVNQSFNSLLSSTRYYNYETITITPGILNNGTYDLSVFVSSISQVTNYTLTISGISIEKTYTRSFGPINANDKYASLKPLSLTVSGSEYTLY